jgi:hypothetical protein
MRHEIFAEERRKLEIYLNIPATIPFVDLSKRSATLDPSQRWVDPESPWKSPARNEIETFPQRQDLAHMVSVRDRLWIDESKFEETRI